MSSTAPLVVRFVHVLGVTLLVGGSVFVWNAIRTVGVGYDTVRFATHYEWLFWGTMAVMVVTGVGNLGSLGAPGPTTRWGTILTAKLGVVTVFVVGSFVRTLVVLTTRRRGVGRVIEDRFRQFYSATSLVLILVVALAEALAHG
ncbi:hypothetical protein GJR96_13045 [Haloferax sp. MBLA0076]|uniref:Copper resistance protein D domain-containing protein n=1 Tax=Haloferax litoreum TaxID=2666140 RepID=A0A6A8GHM6_9EURY|nr:MULTISPECIES: CopD family protein [Haloferax]KAB1194313.1 hypothetical protein Hfx1148_12985 [Haloferax sp. CBA1148]MRX22874.1 hypothetical protein [Haloferax litoreum]